MPADAEQFAIVGVAGHVDAWAFAELEDKAHVIQIRRIGGHGEGAVDRDIAEGDLAGGPRGHDTAGLDTVRGEDLAARVRTDELRGVLISQALDGGRIGVVRMVVGAGEYIYVQSLRAE